MMETNRPSFWSLLFVLSAVMGCSDEGITGTAEAPYTPFQGQNSRQNGTPALDTDATSGEKPVGEEGGQTAEGGGEEGGQSTGLLAFDLDTGDDGELCDGEPTCSVEVTFLSDRDLTVRYERDGEPVQSGLVAFDWIEEDATNFLELDKNKVYTDENGLATVEVSVLVNQPAVFQLRVSAEDDPTLSPITYSVVVSSKLGAPLIVTFVENYDPIAIHFASIETTLFRQTEEEPFYCEQLDLTEKIPSGGIGLPQVENVTDTIEVPTLPGLEQDGEQDYTAVAIGVTLQGALVVVGCNDTDGHVVSGISAVVPITLSPVPPNYTGVYDVTTQLDLLSFLPDEVEQILDAIFGLFESPTGGIALLACTLGSNASALDDFCGFIFANPGMPKIGEWGTIYADLIIQVIDAIVIGLISGNELASDIFFTGKDLSDLLTNLELHSQIEMKPLPDSGKTKSMPDSMGYFTLEQCSQTWTEIAFKWTLNAGCDPLDDSCGAYVFNFAQFSSQEVALSDFEAQVSPGFYDMNIFPHSVNFKYGALLNAILKTFLLPAVFGDGTDGYPKIDEYEEVIQSFMCGKEGLLPQNDCCEIFAENISNNGGGIIANTLEAACDSLIPLGAAYLEALLVDLDTDVENLTLETATPCKLYDNNDDGIIDNWGTVTQPCTWAMKLDLFGANAVFDATFYAVRKE